MSMIKIGVLISGNGSNLQAIIDSINQGEIEGEITVVIASNRKAYGLKRAEENGIDALWINREAYASNTTYNEKMMVELERRDVDLVILAGYIKILSEGFVQRFKNRIINIHPSLIPSFCGKGFYGDKVHQAVLDYGVKVTGATVHFVDKGTDTGPIVFQEVVPVHQEDTVATLKNRVLGVEHRLLVKAVRLYCNNQIHIEGRKVRVRGTGAR